MFSVALTASGEIYAWGSNNNGQIGQGGDDSEASEDKKSKQMDMPTLVQIEVEENETKRFSQILAGDCHVLVKDETCIRAWGQGNIVDAVADGENQYQDVICNQPLNLDIEIINKMVFELGIHSSMTSDLKVQTLYSERSLDETNLKSDQSTSRYDLLTPVQALSPQKRADVPANVPRLALHDLPKLDNLSPAKSMATSLETIKNTDDYNKYMQQKEDRENDQHKLSLMKSSYDHTTKDAREAGTSGREKRSAGSYSDLVPITEETKS